MSSWLWANLAIGRGSRQSKTPSTATIRTYPNFSRTGFWQHRQRRRNTQLVRTLRRSHPRSTDGDHPRPWSRSAHAQAREMLSLAVSSSEPDVQQLAQAALDALKAEDDLMYAVSPTMVERGLFGVPATARTDSRNMSRYDAPTEEGWANVTLRGPRGRCRRNPRRHRRRLRRLHRIRRILQRIQYELMPA